MTDFRESIGFKSLSIIDVQTASVTGEVARYGGWSFTSGFNPGVSGSAGNRSFNPNTANTSEVRNALATLLMDLYKPKS
jgi:hypothetical protein